MSENGLHIRKRFPNKTERIDYLMAQDPEFTNLCEDLDAYVGALQHWIKSKEPEAETRVDEYRALIRELEEEIVQALDALKSSQSS